MTQLTREEIADARSLAARIEAEEILCADMDTYSDWLTSHCMDVPASHTRLSYVPRSEESLANFIESLDVAQLQAATLYPRQVVSFCAAQRLQSLYIAQNSMYIDKLVADVLSNTGAA